MKNFKLNVIMSITTGRLLCTMVEIYEILDYMTGDKLYTHALPRAADECSPYLYEQFPFLREIDKEAEKHEDTWWTENYLSFVDEMVLKYGEAFTVYPIHAEDHEVIDPIEEIKRINPNINVIAITDDIPPEGNIDWKV